jgi:hypothetical protein
MELVLEQLKDKPAGFASNTGYAPPAPEPAAAAAKAASEGLASAGKGLSEAGEAASKGLSSAADSVGGVLGGAADSVAGALGGVGGSVSGALGGAADAAAGAADTAAAAASQAAVALSEALSGANGALSGAAGGAAAQAQQFVDAAVAEFNTEASIIRSNIDSLLGGVTSTVQGTTSALSASASAQVSGAAGAVSGAVSGAVDAVAALLPPEAAAALLAGEQAGGTEGLRLPRGSAGAHGRPECQPVQPDMPLAQRAVCSSCLLVGRPRTHAVPFPTRRAPPFPPPTLVPAADKVGAAVEGLAGMDPAVGGAAAGVGLGLPALLAWRAAYGGYAGVLDPLQALELLQVGGGAGALACRLPHAPTPPACLAGWLLRRPLPQLP